MLDPQQWVLVSGKKDVQFRLCEDIAKFLSIGTSKYRISHLNDVWNLVGSFLAQVVKKIISQENIKL